MNDQLLLHPKTAKQIESFVQSPSHAVLITGPPGSGKMAAAQLLAARLLGLKIDKLGNYPHYTPVNKPDDKQEIPIEAIRGVIKSMNLKIPSDKSGIKRVIIINDAESMSREAQNALLKTLEEPSPQSLIILTAGSASDILPTVASRAQKIQVMAVPNQAARNFFESKYKPADIDSAWRLSQGSAGLLNALLDESAEHPLKRAVNEAKDILRSRPYERLIYFDKLAADKAELANFLDGLGRVLAALHRAAVQKHSAPQAAKLLKSRKLVAQTMSSLGKNTSPRLLCLRLALELPL